MTTQTPIPESPPAVEGKPKKRGLIWLIAFVVVAAVAGYAVYKAGQPNQFITATGGGGGRGGSGGGGGGGRRGAAAGIGPVPVVISKVRRTSVPQYDPALGNV